MLAGWCLLVLRGARTVCPVSVYSRFTEAEKETYFGASMGAAPTLRDFTVSRGGTRSIGLTSSAGIPLKDQLELGRSRVPLNANLARQMDLFNVILVTPQPVNVTKITKKQRYCD